MDGNDAILQHADRANGASDSVRPEAAAARRSPWLQLGTIRRFAWNRYELPVAALPYALEGLRIVHLSDIHLKSAWHPALDELLCRLQRDPPDLIFITGDFVEDKYDGPRAAEPLLERLIPQLRSRCGVYATLGNHDGDFVGPRVARWGVRVLPIGVTTITARGAALELIGLAGVTRGDLEEQDVLDVAPRQSVDFPDVSRPPRIALSHYPDALLRVHKLGVVPDLFFAGHTHGGQVCPPGGMPIIKHDSLPRRLCHGVHRVGDTWLIVSRGMGFSGAPIRMFCSAEIVEVALRGG